MSQSQEYSVLPLEPRLKPIPTNDFLTLSEKVANRITEMSDGIKIGRGWCYGFLSAK